MTNDGEAVLWLSDGQSLKIETRCWPLWSNELDQLTANIVQHLWQHGSLQEESLVMRTPETM